ncbi:MAG TPA: hypothetical protein VIC59_03215 [Gemmatimonadota bacterium]
MRSGDSRTRAEFASAALCLAFAAAACSNSSEPEELAAVGGVVHDVQANTRLFFYDDELNQLGPLSVQVRQDGSYGPLSFATGTFFGAGTASGFTTGQLTQIVVHSPDDSLSVDFDLDPVSVPLAVGNRWTYQELTGPPAIANTVVVEIVASQPGTDGTIYQVEERATDSTSGAADTLTYFLAQTFGGIRKSLDADVTDTDELLLRLPATLGSTWTTADFATGAQLQKRIKALVCDDAGCVETNDFTIAQEPAGNFMSVSEIHEVGSQTIVTVFSDIGIVDTATLDTATSGTVSQRRLTAFQPAGG